MWKLTRRVERATSLLLAVGIVLGGVVWPTRRAEAGIGQIQGAIAQAFGAPVQVAGVPTNGQSLVYSSATGTWGAGTASATPTGPAGGVLSGTYPNPGFAVGALTLQTAYNGGKTILETAGGSIVLTDLTGNGYVLGAVSTNATENGLYVQTGVTTTGAGVSVLVANLGLGPAYQIQGINAIGSNYGCYASQDGSGAAVSAANEGRIRYNATTQTWQQSTNTGAWGAFGGAASLQSSYAGGATITEAGAVPVAISSTTADNASVLTVTKNPAGAQSGIGVNVTMGTNSTGVGVQSTANGTGSAFQGVSGGAAAVFAASQGTGACYQANVSNVASPAPAFLVVDATTQFSRSFPHILGPSGADFWLTAGAAVSGTAGRTLGFYGGAATGTDIAGGTLILASGFSTGAGVGLIQLQLPTATASGSGGNSFTSVLSLGSTSGLVYTPPPTVGATTGSPVTITAGQGGPTNATSGGAISETTGAGVTGTNNPAGSYTWKIGNSTGSATEKFTWMAPPTAGSGSTTNTSINILTLSNKGYLTWASGLASATTGATAFIQGPSDQTMLISAAATRNLILLSDNSINYLQTDGATAQGSKLASLVVSSIYSTNVAPTNGIGSIGVIGWFAGTGNASVDTGLSRDSAGVIDFGTGAAASVAGSWKATTGTLSGNLIVSGVGIGGVTPAARTLAFNTGGSYTLGVPEIVGPTDLGLFIVAGSSGGGTGRPVTVSGGPGFTSGVGGAASLLGGPGAAAGAGGLVSAIGGAAGSSADQSAGGALFGTGFSTGLASADIDMQSGYPLASGSTAQTATDRDRISSKTKALTNNTATTFCNVLLPTSNAGAGVTIFWSVLVQDAAGLEQVTRGAVHCALVNKAGTLTAGTVQVCGTNSANLVTGTDAISFGTSIASTTCSFQVTSNSSLTITSHVIEYRVLIDGGPAVTSAPQ